MEIRTERKKRRRVVGLIFGIAAALFVSVVVAGALILRHQPTVDEAPAVIVPPAAKPLSITSNTLFTGNTFWGRYINDWSMKSPLKTEYPFSRLSEFNRQDYDAWISGLECPTVAGFTQTSAEEDTTLSFNCSPDYLPQAAKWFTAFSLANNHTDNRGAEGFAETKQHLDEQGIQYFGHYDPDELNDVCDVISLPVKVKYDDASIKAGAIPVALCGYHGVFKIPSEASLAVMESYSKVMPVIAMPHMGAEYKAAPDQLKTDTYRAMIDHGADVVFGDHPHWIQTTESYKGHLIVYSMGNFIFDQQGPIEVTRSAAINMAFSAESTSDDLQQWLAIGDTCKTYHDDCLEKIQTTGLSKLPFNYQYGVIGTSDSDKITKPATSDQQASILMRLNWSNTMNQLQAPYSSL